MPSDHEWDGDEEFAAETGDGLTGQRFLMGIAAATVGGAGDRPIHWKRQGRVGGTDYIARMRFGGRALYLTLYEDESTMPVGLQVQVRQGDEDGARPTMMREIIRAYEVCGDDNDQMLTALHDMVRSQVHASERAKGSNAKDAVLEMRSEIPASDVAILEGFLGCDLNDAIDEAMGTGSLGPFEE